MRACLEAKILNRNPNIIQGRNLVFAHWRRCRQHFCNVTSPAVALGDTAQAGKFRLVGKSTGTAERFYVTLENVAENHTWVRSPLQLRSGF